MNRNRRPHPAYRRTAWLAAALLLSGCATRIAPSAVPPDATRPSGERTLRIAPEPVGDATESPAIQCACTPMRALG